MNSQTLDLTELNTLILVIKVLVAAAWADGEMDTRERKLLEQMISKARLSESRKASLMISIEHKPTAHEIDQTLLELCQRAKTEEMKQAIIALTDKMFASDSKLDASEIAFRERLEQTLLHQGKNFFQTIIERLRNSI